MEKFLFYFSCFCMLHFSTSFIVEAPCGKLQGIEVTAVNKKTYFAFRNIPYAKSPIGNLRFAKPEPHPVFDGVFDATKDEIIFCPQPVNSEWLDDDTLEKGDEDCLIANVYVPNLDSVQRKVMVYIHGGGFVTWSSAFHESGSFVTEQNVILVTINYRLGALGFLSTENEASLGNYGLFDQALALKWVKDNIAVFGGDPDDIAISGESAGGSSVTFLSISPFTKGLFTKTYSQSGTASSTFSKALRPLFHTLTAAKELKCWEGNVEEKLNLRQSQEIIDCLRKIPAHDFGKFSNFDLSEHFFVPRVDGEFVPKTIGELLKDDEYLKSVGFFNRSYLFGLDNNEKGLLGGALNLLSILAFRNKQVSEDEKIARVKNFFDKVEDFHLKSRLDPFPVSKRARTQVIEWYQRRYIDYHVELVNDLFHLVPIYDFLDALARNKSSKAWLLHFNHYPNFMKGTVRGTVHAADLLYWFDFPAERFESLVRCGMDGNLDEEELAVKSLFSGLVGEFTRSGVLTHALKDVMPGEWPTYDLQGSHYLDFSPEPRVKSQLQIEKKELWLKKVPAWLKQDLKREQRDEL